MAIRVTCPGCKKNLIFADAFRGSMVQCPDCAEMLQAGEALDDVEVIEPVTAAEPDVPTLEMAPPEPAKPSAKPKSQARQPARPTPRPAEKERVAPKPARGPASKKTPSRPATSKPTNDFSSFGQDDGGSGAYPRRRHGSSAGTWVALAVGVLLVGGAGTGIAILMNQEKEPEKQVTEDDKKGIDKKTTDKGTDDKKPTDKKADDKKPDDKKPDDKKPTDKKPTDKNPVDDRKPPEVPASNPFGITPVVMDQDRVTHKLPAAVDDVAVAGGGRYLILHMAELHKLAVFDVSAAKIKGQIDTPGPAPRFTAGLDKLVVLQNATTLERYDLETLKLEQTVETPVKLPVGVPKEVVMGNASRGPLLLSYTNDRGQFGMKVLDLANLAPIPMQPTVDLFEGMKDDQLRASGSGRVFGWWNSQPQPTGKKQVIITFYEGTLTLRQAFTPSTYVVPGPGDQYIFGSTGIYTADMEPVGTVQTEPTTIHIPAVHGDLSLVIDQSRGKDPIQKNAALHVVGMKEPLGQLQDLELPPAFNEPLNRLTLDRRIFLVPAAKALITLPRTNDRLVYHRLEPTAVAARAPGDYLFVESVPPARVDKGTELKYQIAARSRHAGMTYRLKAGPPGLEMSPTGLITWKVPADAGPRVDVVAEISDSSFKTVVHSFRLSIGSPVEGTVASNPTDPVKPPDPGPGAEKAVTVKLPAPAVSSCIAAGGRMLVFHLPKKKQLAIVDIAQARVVREIPLTSDKVEFTAGLEKLVLVSPADKAIQSWDLATGQRELSVPYVPGEDFDITKAGMGSASQGPVLLVTSVTGQPNLTLLDLKTLKALPGAALKAGPITIDGTLQVRAAMNGTIFSLWNENPKAPPMIGGGSGLQVLTIDGNKLNSYTLDRGPLPIGSAVPNGGGSLIYTEAGVYTNTGQALGRKDFASNPLLPSYNGPYYMTVYPVRPTTKEEQFRKMDLSFHYEGSGQQIFMKRFVEGLETARVSEPALPLSQRIHFFPDTKRLVAIAETGDRLVIHGFDPVEALEKSNTDFIIVTSRPPRSVDKGEMLSYQLEVKSKKKELTYKVFLGPEGMAVTPTGLVTWKAPANFAKDRISASIAVSDGTTELKHSFTVLVGKPVAVVPMPMPMPMPKSTLVVTSRPPIAARRGAAYVYQLAAKGAKGVVNVKLEKAPEGMVISPEGRITWLIPVTQPVGNVEVQVSLKDAAGQETLYTFNVPVR